MNAWAIQMLLALEDAVGHIRLLIDEVKAVQTPAREIAHNIRGQLRSRRLREKFFEAGLFGDAKWDILLELYAASLDCSEIAVSRACSAASVPPSTALRHVTQLQNAGWLRRVPDWDDRRRSFLELTDKGRTAMQSYLAKVAQIEATSR